MSQLELGLEFLRSIIDSFTHFFIHPGNILSTGTQHSSSISYHHDSGSTGCRMTQQNQVFKGTGSTPEQWDLILVLM